MDAAFCAGLSVHAGLSSAFSNARSLHPILARRAVISRPFPARRARITCSSAPSSTPPSPEGDAFRKAARGGRSDDGSRDAEFEIGPKSASAEDDNELLRVVKSVSPPELVQRFTEAAPPVVQGAIRQTLMRMLGSLPPIAFSTSVETMSQNLVQLFHSCLISGYMFRNAAYRLELTRSLDRSDLPALPARESVPEIQGGVAVFRNDDGTQVEVPVEKYVQELRNTVGGAARRIRSRETRWKRTPQLSCNYGAEKFGGAYCECW